MTSEPDHQKLWGCCNEDDGRNLRFLAARKIAARDGTTLRALVEQGLRCVVAERKRSRVFRLRKASFKGRGLRPELKDAEWERVRALAYEGHGG